MTSLPNLEPRQNVAFATNWNFWNLWNQLNHAFVSERGDSRAVVSNL